MVLSFGASGVAARRWRRPHSRSAWGVVPFRDRVRGCRMCLTPHGPSPSAGSAPGVFVRGGDRRFRALSWRLSPAREAYRGGDVRGVGVMGVI